MVLKTSSSADRSLVSGTWFLYRTESSGINILSEDALTRWSFDYICKAADSLRLIAATLAVQYKASWVTYMNGG